METKEMIDRLLALRSVTKKQIDEIDYMLKGVTELEKKRKGFNSGVLDVKKEG